MMSNPLTSRVVTTCIEPTFMGIGPSHLAVGLDNSAYFYNISNAEGDFLLMFLTYCIQGF